LNTGNISPNEVSAIQIAFKLHPLTAVRVWKTRLASNALAIIVDMILCRDQMKVIDFTSMSIPKPDLGSLPRLFLHMKSITHLTLDHTKLSTMTTPALEAIKENVNDSLICFSARFCGLDVTNLDPLSKLIEKSEKLSILDISGNQIRDDGVALLAPAVEISRSLQTLNISFNEIEDLNIKEAIPLQKLCIAVSTNKNIINLSLSGNFFGSRGFEHVIQALQYRKQLIESGSAPSLQIQVPERINNALYDKVHSLNSQMVGKARKGKGKKSN
jgi:Leucine-rich repeat (LRR) protein